MFIVPSASTFTRVTSTPAAFIIFFVSCGQNTSLQLPNRRAYERAFLELAALCEEHGFHRLPVAIRDDRPLVLHKQVARADVRY